MKRIITGVCAFLIGASVFAAGGSDGKRPVDAGKSVELIMYLIGSPARDYDKVLAVFNEKAKADLGVTLKVNFIGWGDFGTKYPLVLASGEPIDLIYTATWLNFTQQAMKGAFKPLETIGPQYAPQSFAEEPKEAIRQATLNGHVYALPPNYTNYSTYGPIVRGDLMKKYGISDIATLDDYGKYLDAIATNEVGMDPSGLTSTQHAIDALQYYGMGLYPLSGDTATNSPFWIKIGDPEGKIINIVDLPETASFARKMKGWSEKGYWPRSVLSNKDNQMMQAGKAASRIHLIDSWIQEYQLNPQWDVRFTTMLPHSFPLPYMQDGMAIPTSSKNPEKALRLLEKLRTDESYYMLLTYGLAGVHYEIAANNQLKPLDMDGWQPEAYCSWGFRDSRFKRDYVGSPPNLEQVREAIKKSAVENIYASFSQDIDPVKNEYSAVMNAMQQYFVPLKLGYIDPSTGLATLKEKLKAAGVEKVQAELQRQVDAYRASLK